MEQKDIDKVIGAVEERLEKAVEKYEGQVKDAGTAAEELRAEVKSLAEQHKSAVEQSEELQSRLRDVEQKAVEGFKPSADLSLKSWGDQFVSSESFKSLAEGNRQKARIEVKNTILGEGGSPQDPENTLVPQDRMPGIVPGAFRALTILDFVPTGGTSSNQMEYTRELAWTNNAAERAEGVEKAESDLTFELVNDPVRTIAHWLKVSKQVMDDAPALSSYVDRRLRHGVRQRLQRQIVQGNGTSPNLAGITASGRHTAFTPESGEIALDALNRAKYAVIAADYTPNFIWMNPADWGEIERTKVGTGDSRYAVGDGNGLSYINNGMTPMVWGLPVVASNDIPSGEFILGDSNAFQLFMRQGAVVEMFEQDEDNVQHNLLTIRAEVRAAMCVFTPAAIRHGDLLAGE